MRARAPRRLPAGVRLTGWLLAYLLLTHLVLGAFAAGAMAATALSGDNAGLLCTTHVDAATDGTSDTAPSDQHAPHCVLCPLAGGTPLVPEPTALPAPLASPRVAEIRTPATRTIPVPPLHESARPRAPPAVA